MTTRARVPDTTRQAVLIESGYKCANPVCRHVLTLELHHIEWVKDGGGNEPENLLALCPNCHALHTAGQISRNAINAWKSLLVSIGNPNRASVDVLLILADEEFRIANDPSPDSAPRLRYTGDSLFFPSVITYVWFG